MSILHLACLQLLVWRNYNLPMRSNPLSSFFFLLSSFLLTSCISRGINPTSLPSSLVPFATSTRSPIPPTDTLQTPEGVVAAETPLPTPTPFTYTVQRGDTI